MCFQSSQGDKQTGSTSLAALVVLIPVVQLIALIYPFGVLIAKYFYLKDKSKTIVYLIFVQQKIFQFELITVYNI